jgi:hypothetical protein
MGAIGNQADSIGSGGRGLHPGEVHAEEARHNRTAELVAQN